MINVFKEIKILKDVLTSKKDCCINEKDRLLIKEQLELLNEIEEYILQKLKSPAKERIGTYLKYNCSTHVVMDKYDMTLETVEKCISRASESIRSKIGTNVIKLIDNGDVEDARDLFCYRSGKYKLKDYLLAELGESLPKEGKYMTIKLSDCNMELRFIFEYSKAGYNKALGNIDPIKLAYIKYILEEDSPKLATHRTVLHKLLTEGKYNAIIAEIKEKDL